MLIGPSLRQARLRRGLSARELARLVNVSASFISQVENDKAQPSVGTLYQLANALEMSLDAIVDGDGVASNDEVPSALTPPQRGRFPLRRAHERPPIQLDSGVTWEQLAPDPDRYTDFLLVTYAPGGSSAAGGSFVRHAGTEFGLVIEGTLDVTLAFDTYTLAPGDSIAFPSQTPHRLHNRGDVDTKAVWIVVGRDGDTTKPH